MAQAEKGTLNIEATVNEVLGTIDRDREKEIISRRFGLFDRKETLEQIGELLGITRERVRQLEKAVVVKLKAQAQEGKLPGIEQVQASLTDAITDLGGASRISALAAKLVPESSRLEQSRVAFLCQLAPAIVVVDENDYYYQSAGLEKLHDEKKFKSQVETIIEAIKKIGEPTDVEKVAAAVKMKDSAHVAALASTSKQLATLNDRWGLIKWPMVNPKNIRDKIYVILKENTKPMHFVEIADSIKQSDFKRKDVTTQAIHNELIKDKRFVLIGRGIYALKEWGYEKGTVADIITEVLKKAKEPLHRDEIVKRVLKSRQVKETTILLNLQGKSQFKRVAKATYALAE